MEELGIPYWSIFTLLHCNTCASVKENSIKPFNTKNNHYYCTKNWTGKKKNNGLDDHTFCVFLLKKMKRRGKSMKMGVIFKKGTTSCASIIIGVIKSNPFTNIIMMARVVAQTLKTHTNSSCSWHDKKCRCWEIDTVK